MTRRARLSLRKGRHGTNGPLPSLGSSADTSVLEESYTTVRAQFAGGHEPESKRIAVVVLNWNNSEDTIECLSSLRASDDALYIAVVDNGSVDGSAERIESTALADVLLRTGRNLGFAGGNNVGLRHVLSGSFEMVVVLNNDTIASPALLTDQLVLLREHPGSAISPYIVYADEPEYPWFMGGVVDNGWPRHVQREEVSAPVGRWQSSETLTGCSIAASPATWRQVGLFDERLFLIFEDSDWSIRAREAGVGLYVAGHCILRHKVSRSFQGGVMALLGSFYFVRNGLYFQEWHAPRHLPSFIAKWVVRPTVRGVYRRDGLGSALFAWVALACWMGRQGGKAPRIVERIAHSWGD